jgi:hypothetical protein
MDSTDTAVAVDPFPAAHYCHQQTLLIIQVWRYVRDLHVGVDFGGWVEKKRRTLG